MDFAGGLREFASEAHVMHVHVGLNIGRRGRWRGCLVPEVDRVAVVSAPDLPPDVARFGLVRRVS